MKSKLFLLVVMLTSAMQLSAQTDKDALSLKISKADDENMQKLKEYVWKRRSNVYVDSKLMLTTITEFSFNPEGKLEARIIDAESSVKKKPGLRGKMQSGAVEEKMDYIQKGLSLSMAYAFMSKGEMLDFISKATITEKDGQIEAVATDVRVKGDRLLVRIDPATYLYTYKEFSSLLGADKISGKLNYEKFSNGTNHLSTTKVEMPVQKTTIEAVNEEYTIRVK